MSDEFGNTIPAPAGERVGFCQDCGKPLTQETVRTVGSGVFCEPCLETRVGAAGQATNYGTPVAGPTAAGYTPPVSSHAASPVLAGFLGLIPGVGAMYNGQFAKGIVHLVIFTVLVMLSDNVSGVFGLFVFGWICYQAFEAYHTAKARLEGLPLPNVFGFNDIGERMGFGKNWPGSMTRPSTAPPVTPWTPTPVPPVPPSNWAGYVPPDAFTAAQTVVPPVEPVAHASRPGSWGSSPYYASPPPPPYSAPYVPVATGVPMPSAIPPVPSRKFPVGAIWLIGLGLLFLLSINAHVRFSGLWLSAAIFAGLSVWMFAHRILQLHRVHPVGIPTGTLVACVLRWPPVILMVLAVLFALQAASLYTLGQTWPVIFIALGAVVLMERTVGRAAQFSAEEHPPVAAWTTDHRNDDATKGGAQ